MEIGGKDQSLTDSCTLFDPIRRDRGLRGVQKTTWENRGKKYVKKKLTGGGRDITGRNTREGTDWQTDGQRSGGYQDGTDSVVAGETDRRLIHRDFSTI